MYLSRSLQFILGMLLLSLSAHAEFTLAPLFADNAVLQRDKTVPIWGKGDAGDAISVAFAGQTKTGEVDSTGRWQVNLDPLKLSTTPAEMVITAKKAGASVTLKNIVVGDVWFCSGQSNMAWAVMRAANPDEESAAANYPLIRGFRCPLRASTKAEFSIDAHWTPCAPAKGDDDTTVRGWSAAAYFFARDVHKATGVPIGIIMSAYGGTRIESWMSQAGLKDSGLQEPLMKRWQMVLEKIPEQTVVYEKNLAAWKEEAAKAQAAGGKPARREPKPPGGPGTREEPTSLFNAMVNPFVPAAIRGIIWYQGESNASRAAEYAKLFPAMIRQWRKDFGQGDIPFYFVQIANFSPAEPEVRRLAFLRESQTAGLHEPATGMATAVDIGEPKQIHPKNKQEVGRRLSLHALNGVYDKPQPVSGPVFLSAAPRKSEMVISFQDNPELVLRQPNAASAFEVAGADKVFHPASATIEKDTVIVSCPEVAEPVAVRYAWFDNPTCVLYGASGLPAPPFRSDDWPQLASEKPESSTPSE